MNRLLMFLHSFVGVGALAGGLGAILNPKAPMGTPVYILKNSPFNDFLIPGIILFVVIGLGNVISALVIRANLKYRLYLSNVFSWALVIWIIVQCFMLRDINILHVIFFLIGLIEVILATSLMFKHRLYPTNIVINFYNKKKGI
ncbi:hypothetical protein [Natronospora cellulosivora (SeqCode)]